MAGGGHPPPCARWPVGQGPSGPDWLATALGFWSGRALATGTVRAGLYLIHHHRWLAVAFQHGELSARRDALQRHISFAEWADPGL